MTVREYAKSVGFEVVGKLKRMKKNKRNGPAHYRYYIDEAGNEYWKSRIDGICIVTADGGVI